MLDSHYLSFFKVNVKVTSLKFYFTALLLLQLHGEIHEWLNLLRLNWFYSFQCIYKCKNVNLSRNNAEINLIVNEKTIV